MKLFQIQKYKNEDSNNIKKYLLKYASRNKWFEYVTRYNRQYEKKEIIRKVDDSVTNLKEIYFLFYHQRTSNRLFEGVLVNIQLIKVYLLIPFYS